MATNVNNAERLRSYFLSHKQRENIINVCRARPNWDNYSSFRKNKEGSFEYSKSDWNIENIGLIKVDIQYG